jgi:hypothetical protein
MQNPEENINMQLMIPTRTTGKKTTTTKNKKTNPHKTRLKVVN